jgi:hypothetical protein
MDTTNFEPDPTANRVLVLTESSDMTADLVVKELDRRGAQVFRADTGDFPLSLQVSALAAQETQTAAGTQESPAGLDKGRYYEASLLHPLGVGSHRPRRLVTRATRAV